MNYSFDGDNKIVLEVKVMMVFKRPCKQSNMRACAHKTKVENYLSHNKVFFYFAMTLCMSGGAPGQAGSLPAWC